MSTITNTTRLEEIRDAETFDLESNTVLFALLSGEIRKSLKEMTDELAEKAGGSSTPSTTNSSTTQSTTSDTTPVGEEKSEDVNYAEAIIAAMAAVGQNLSNTINKSAERSVLLNKLAESSLEMAKKNLARMLGELQDYIKWEIASRTASMLSRIMSYVVVVITWIIAAAITVLSGGWLAAFAIAGAMAATTFLILDETGMTEEILEKIADWWQNDMIWLHGVEDMSDEDAMYWAMGIWGATTILGPMALTGGMALIAKIVKVAGTAAAIAQTVAAAKAAADAAKAAQVAGDAAEVAKMVSDAAAAARAAADATKNVATTASKVAVSARTAKATETALKAADQAENAANIARNTANTAETAADGADAALRALNKAIDAGMDVKDAMKNAVKAAQKAAKAADKAADAADAAEKAATITNIASKGGKFTHIAEKMMRTSKDVHIDDLAKVANTTDDAKSLNKALETVVNNPSLRASFINASRFMSIENAAHLVYALHMCNIMKVLVILQGVFGAAEGGFTSATGYCYYEMGKIKLEMAESNKNQVLIQASSDFTDLMIDTENGNLATQMNALSAIMNNMKTTLYRQQQHLTHYMG